MKRKLHLYLFHDDIEEFLVAAKDKEDAFTVIEEAHGSDAADQLVMSGLHEYPDNFKLQPDKTAGKLASKRKIVSHGGPGTFIK